MAKEKTNEELAKEVATLKKKLAGKETYINSLKKDLAKRSVGPSKAVQH